MHFSPRFRSVLTAFALSVACSFAIAGCGGESPANSSNSGTAGNSPAANSTLNQTKVVRFGYQKSTILLKSKGTLDKRLEAEGVKVEWSEFPAGPPLLEALNVGAIDIGPVGESPPVFAQAAGANLVYAIATNPSPQGSALLVPQNSPIKTVADLKGKKVAFAKGSSANLLIVQLLGKAGLQFGDIQPVYLPPADARAAFSKGSVDAWVIWDPFYAAAQGDLKAKVIADGKDVTKQGGYYITSRKFATENPKILKIVLEEIQKQEQWAQSNRDEFASFIAPVLKVDLAVSKTAAQRRKFGLIPITPELISLQQEVADTYYKLKLIPKPISVKDATLKPEEYVGITPTGSE